MKAFLLAAGLGTRLRPLTDSVPKCLVTVAGRPMLDWWMDLFTRHGITDVLINTNYLHEQVSAYIIQHNNSGKKPTIKEFYEPELLGSGGTVLGNRDFIDRSESFFICYADNITNVNLSDLLAFHNKHDGVLSMALFRSDNPRACGIASLDDDDCITSFIEKPDNPQGNLANAGIYLANNKIFSYFPEVKICDFGKDVLPRLIGKMYGWQDDYYLLDIGTIENYHRANIEWPMIMGKL